MRIDYRLFFSVLLVLGACSGKPERPAYVIPEDRMTLILTDVSIIDGESFNVQQQPDSLYKYLMSYYSSIFKRYHTDTAQFRKSFVWYTKNPEELDAIYDNVLKMVQKKSDSVNRTPETVQKDTPKATPTPIK